MVFYNIFFTNILLYFTSRVCTEHKKSAQVEKAVRSTNFNQFVKTSILICYCFDCPILISISGNSQQLPTWIAIVIIRLKPKPRCRNLTIPLFRLKTLSFGTNKSLQLQVWRSNRSLAAGILQEKLWEGAPVALVRQQPGRHLHPCHHHCHQHPCHRRNHRHFHTSFAMIPFWTQNISYLGKLLFLWIGYR